MLPALVLAGFNLLGTLANGLDCTFTERCRSGICDSVEAPVKVLFSPTPNAKKPAVFVVGDARIVEGPPVTEAAVHAVTQMFRDFAYKPDSYAYTPAALTGYDPAGGTVQLLLGGRQINIGVGGKADAASLREGTPGLSWITTFTGQCSARTYP